MTGQDAVVVPSLYPAPSSLATVRSLGRAGVRTIAVGSSETMPPFASKYCDEAYRAPAPGDDIERYGDVLLKLAARDDVVTVVPLREADVYVLSTRRDEFAEHVATPWPDYDTVESVQDGLRLVDIARDAGVAVPETVSLDEWDGWDGPAAVKSRYSILVEDGETFYPGVELLDAGETPDRDAITEQMRHVPIVQEFIPGDDEVGFFAMFDHGEPVATFQHRRIRSYTYKGGASVYREAIDDPDLEAAGLSLLKALDWHGPAMVEFKRDERDGSYTLIEINPRFWGSLQLAVHAGVDFPYHYYRVATGDPAEPTFDYDVGTASHVLRGELIYLTSLLTADDGPVDPPSLRTEIPAVLRSFVEQPNFDYLSLDDPMPFATDMWLTLEAVLP
ncbi:ATP-grasp domain-containing protein [Halomarina salina]|uniref:ATP-grasp domain-containing protein n=1 Tax=Halomarina salina TaxID=1872699 RepID=A0ABD5RPN5_9EURY|nr:ATP-grasp domain-containing protein [Halomarina salina]